jgi:hypothetical protein
MGYRDEREGPLLVLIIRKAITSILYYRDYKRIFPEIPNYTPGAIRYLNRILNKETRVFEYGCDNSSLWYSKRTKEYIAVEHDIKWFNRIKKQLPQNDTENSQLLFVALNRDAGKFDWQKEWPHYKKIQRPSQNVKYMDYIRSIGRYPDQYFDIIVIDGRERVHCLLEALPKLNDSGVIIFDDSNRPRYKEIFSIMHNWDIKSFNFGLAQTTFFRRKNKRLTI